MDRKTDMRNLMEAVSFEANEPAVRKTTRRLLELIGEGMLDPETLARACLSYMSEDDVADMAYDEGFLDYEGEEDE